MRLDLAPLWISLKTTFASTALVLILGVAAASWRTGRQSRLWERFDGVLLLPVVFSWAATGIAATVVTFPLMYLTACGALDQIDTGMLEAARTLGASEWEVFISVALPLAWPGVL